MWTGNYLHWQKGWRDMPVQSLQCIWVKTGTRFGGVLGAETRCSGWQWLKSRAQACRGQTASIWSSAVSKEHLSGSCHVGWQWKSPVESQTSSPVNALSSGWGWPRKTARLSVIFTFFFPSYFHSVYILTFHIECCSCLTTALSSRWRVVLSYSWMLLYFCAFPSFLGFFTWKADTCMAVWV